MRARALLLFAALAVVACGSGRPDVDGWTNEMDEDAALGGAGGRNDAAPGIRLLTDVSLPREAEGRGTGGSTERDAGARETETVRDGSSEHELERNALDAPAETRRDVAVEARYDASADMRRTESDAPGRSDVSSDTIIADVTTADADDRDADVTTADADDRDSDVIASDPDAAVTADAVTTADADATTAVTTADATPDVTTADAGDTADHLLISEVVTRPSGAEFIEIVNPTHSPVVLSNYLISDSHLYYKVATGTFTTASGSDFVARFPEGSSLEPGRYAVVALGNASGGSSSFQASYGTKPDFELRPTASGAGDDPEVPNMQPAQPGSSIGATASLTDGGEPVMLFVYRGGDLVSDVDYLFFGTSSASNPVVDKTGVTVGASSYLNDSPGSTQRPASAPSDSGSLHRCIYAESEEKGAAGNGLTGHDETSEDMATAFAIGTSANERTPGGPPPARLCGP